MTKKVLLITVLFISSIIYSQKAQRIGYIDMDYILENIPEYQDAQSQLNAKARSWQTEIDEKEQEIKTLIADFNNEKALLTETLIEDRKEDIDIKEQELNKLRLTYFGANGSLYFYRQQLVKPIQDLVFNAVQDIAIKRKYDFVLDKSSNLTMLYTNNRFDISDQVIQSITRSKKIEASKNRGKNINVAEDTSKKEEINEKAAQRQTEREIRKQELKKQLEAKRAAQKKKREDLKKAIEAKRQKRLKAIEDAKKAKEEKNKQEE